MSASLSDNLRGAALMVAASACYAFNDMFVKILGSDMPLSQLLVMRGALTILFISLLTWRAKAFLWNLSGKDWILVLIRSFAELITAYLFLYALRRMDLASVTAILQALPLTVALGAAIFFKDPLGWRRLTAIFVGFLGMLLIVRPGTDAFTVQAVSALGAVFWITVRDLSSRKISDEVPSLMVSWVTAVVITVGAGGIMTGIEWKPVTTQEGGIIVAMAVCMGGAYLFSTMVMRVGDIAFIAPFRYTGLIWALILGLLAFGDWPDQLTLLGAAIVVGTGLFTLYREAKLKRA